MEHHVIDPKWFRNIFGKSRWKFLIGRETAQTENPLKTCGVTRRTEPLKIKFSKPEPEQERYFKRFNALQFSVT